MNPYGILTSYEQRMKANLQRYQRPEKAGTFCLRLDNRIWVTRVGPPNGNPELESPQAPFNRSRLTSPSPGETIPLQNPSKGLAKGAFAIK